MQNITVKVCYKGKTLIVGKGINSIDEIAKELVKRFPEVEQIKSSLTVEYENGAEDLLQAYKLAEKQNKRFIKVKFSSGQMNERSFFSDILNESSVVSVVDPSEEKDQNRQFIKSQEIQTEIHQSSEPNSQVFVNLDDERFEISPKITVTQGSLKNQVPSSEQKLLVDQAKKLQTQKEPKVHTEVRENQSLMDNLPETNTQSEQMENSIDYSLIDEYFPLKEEREIVVENKEEKRQVFYRLFGSKDENSKKQESLNSDAMAILEIVRKEFDTKIYTLQDQYNDLKIKYNDLSSKYDRLSILYGSNQEDKAENKGYVKIPSNDSKHKNEPSKLPMDHSAEISEFSTMEFANVQSVFRFKNVGWKKWPQNLFSQEQDSQDFVQIKSLEPKESAIVTLHTVKAQKVGQTINKKYQLVYFDNLNNVRKFGRVFGISVKVVEKKVIDPFFSIQKPVPNKMNNVKKADPTIEFRSYINEIMSKNNLTKKGLYDVIGCLREFDVTEKNFKDCEAKTLTEFIRSICQ